MTNLRAKFEVSMFTYCKDTKSDKNAKIEVVWRVRSYPRSRQHNHSIHDFRFDFNRNNASIVYRFRVVASYSSKVANFNLPHLRLSPPYGVIPFKFRRNLWRQKTGVPGL